MRIIRLSEDLPKPVTGNLAQTHWDIKYQGISYERAVELEGHEHPPMAAAWKHFDSLTPQEQASTIAATQLDLASAKADHRAILDRTNKTRAEIKDRAAKGEMTGGDRNLILPGIAKERASSKDRIDGLIAALASLQQRAQPIPAPPQPDWTAKKVGSWKKSKVWEVFYKGQLIGNAFGEDAAEAIGMAQHTRPDLPR